jgi:hypothetical protein
MLNLMQAYYDIKTNGPYPQWLSKVGFISHLWLLSLIWFSNFKYFSVPLGVVKFPNADSKSSLNASGVTQNIPFLEVDFPTDEDTIACCVFGRTVTQWIIVFLILSYIPIVQLFRSHSLTVGCCTIALTQILFYYMISLLFLFGNFYVQKYIKPSSGKQKGAKTEWALVPAVL